MSPYQFENPLETVSYTKQELLDKIAEKKAAFESAGYSASIKGRALEIRTLLTLESWLKICFSDEDVNYSDSLLESFIDALSMEKASEMFAGHQMTPELLEKTKVFLHDGLKFALNDPTRKMPIRSLEDLGKAFQRTFNINSYEENEIDRKDDRRVISLIVRQLQQFEGVENQDLFTEAFYRYSEIIHLLETTAPDKKGMQFYIDIQGHARDVHKLLQKSLQESTELGESVQGTRRRVQVEIERSDFTDSALRLRRAA